VVGDRRPLTARDIIRLLDLKPHPEGGRRKRGADVVVPTDIFPAGRDFRHGRGIKIWEFLAVARAGNSRHSCRLGCRLGLPLGFPGAGITGRSPVGGVGAFISGSTFGGQITPALPLSLSLRF
jgi:hypothetical protein